MIFGMLLIGLGDKDCINPFSQLICNFAVCTIK